MLVLTRKSEERIQIGPDITVTILRVKGGTVRVGVEAPADVKILRGELDLLTPDRGQHEPVIAPSERPAPSGAAPEVALPGGNSGSETARPGQQNPVCGRARRETGRRGLAVSAPDLRADPCATRISERSALSNGNGLRMRAAAYFREPLAAAAAMRTCTGGV